MTEFNTSTLISFSALGYTATWWALTLPFVFLIGLLFYAITVAKKWKIFNGISVAHYFSERYGCDVGYFVAIILFLAMIGFSATYVKSLTLVFLPVFPLHNSWILSALLVFMILLMTLRGGLISIIRIDIISFIIILFFLPTLLYYTWHLSNLEPVPSLTLQEMQCILPTQFIISLILLTMFSYILAPWYGQKIVAADSPRTAFLAVICAAILIFLFYGIGIIATSLLKLKGIALTQPELALPYLIHFALPVWLRGLAYGILFCVAATTLAGVWSAMVTLTIGYLPRKQNANTLKFSVLMTIMCAILSYYGANLFVDQVFNKMLLANIPIVALSFALLSGFYWEKTSRFGVYISIIIGLIWGIGCYYIFGDKGLYTWYWALYGIPLIFASGILGSVVFPTR
ncbi:MAG: sodium:solute symporter [Gammaproteobacteria bacterium]|nr:sodium:solute symporter [Gammaproteobacteria bacterium]